MEQQSAEAAKPVFINRDGKITRFVAAMSEDIDELNRLNSSEAESGTNDHQADKKAGTTDNRLARKPPYRCPNSQVI